MDPIDRLQSLLASSDPQNPDAEGIAHIVDTIERVAVVGISRDPAKAARRVPSYMAAKGYDILPVNPHADRLLGKPVFGCLTDIHDPVDLVLVFRPPAEAAQVMERAMMRPERPIIWLQEGIRADEAAAGARAAGFTVVQDLCFYKVHRALHESAPRT